ncbi:phage major capsid protein [Clostridium butyricum]|uniref:phage major capsid protein n=1 Tax=Clostridium butyricum TaxID=1492 RepID=UPI000903817D|nr:phage major capsid protein [Clostridium butyricum]APF22038.1 phage major capsid protein, HK97 family [Clostridium butyricum]
MNKQEYLELRNGLYTEAETLINEGKLEEGKSKMEEIKNLDTKFENESIAMANLNALGSNAFVTDINALSNNVNGRIIASTKDNTLEEESFTNSVGYRKAFMNYVVNGTTIPGELKNAAGPTKTGDVGEIIPETVLQKIIEKLESTGMILPLITRTSIKGGVTVPISTVKPVATWVSEGSGSDKQKKTTGSITFAYHKLRCAISVSFETDLMALPVFETTLISNITEAMTKALEQSIISGTGTGQPKGILTETVNKGQNIDIVASGKIDYDTLINAEAALPLEYENSAVWFMTKKTFMMFIGITDSNGQPIARVNYGINGVPERILLGRRVILNNYMESYADTVTSDTVVAFLFNPSDYVLNTNYSMGIKKYTDDDTDDLVTRAIMIADGKVVIKDSLVTVTKKNA